MIFEMLLVIMVGLVIVAVHLKDLIHAVIVLAAADVVMAVIFMLLAAPDVAITQAAIVAGLTTMIFVVAISKSLRMEEA
ncbi:MAG: hydrogenase subunit MbhD domain-containing protein [Nanoarchaeota archaeon]